MTEAEWLACTDPEMMLKFLRGRASERKPRLFAVACCRLFSDSFTAERSRRAVNTAERHADTPLAGEELATIQMAAVIRLKSKAFTRARAIRELPVWVLTREAVISAGGVLARTLYAMPESRPHLCQLLRDIVGNPFLPVTVNPAWLTSTVVSLAQAIYTDRAFDRLPILADALEDASCDQDDILAHCRGPGRHVLGCFVVDALLGKE